MTRVQKERFSDLMEYERVKNVYILKERHAEERKGQHEDSASAAKGQRNSLRCGRKSSCLLYPASQNGLYAREAIFCYVLGITLDDIKSDKQS
jgi:aspartate carbamoyltransferase catalytic subunit